MIVETPSGKRARDENFPVGSWLLPAAIRPHVAVFYAYARAIDDIADNPRLEGHEKISRLNGFEAALRDPDSSAAGFAKAHAIRDSMTATNVAARHCIDLLGAFRQDATKNRYASWSQLIDYCVLSAAPVGRYLIDLHGESPAAYPASDALCNALQILNHLQDCQDDHATLDRVYLPGDWMAQAGVSVAALAAPAASAGLRQVLDKCLDATEALLDIARGLPSQLRNTRFAVEAAMIVRIARRLAVELRRRDPLAERVVLHKLAYIGCGMAGLWDALRR
jgi:squalene synthase HpnC